MVSNEDVGVIAIWDLEWYHKISFRPNIAAMKVSSFYKQNGAATFLVEWDYDLNFKYDKLYIFREKDDTPMPKIKELTDPKTVLLGEGFKFLTKNELSEIIAKCRPDYLLYNFRDSSKFKNTTFIQLFHNGSFLGRIQEPGNKDDKRTIVIDKNFWEASDDDIVAALQALNVYQNISFDCPIALEKLSSNKEILSRFMKLDLSKTIKHIFSVKEKDEKKILEIINVIKFLKENAVKIRKISTTFSNIDLIEKENFNKVFHSNMMLLAFAKRNRIEVNFALDREINYWSYYPVAAHFSWWTNSKLTHLSLIESFCVYAGDGLPWYLVLNDTKYWKTKVCLLLELLTHNKFDCMEYGTIKIGVEKIGKNLINWKSIKKYDFKYYFLERN